ncbi:MAG: ABC transporter ATP-binding protein [Clostridiales bacterium]|nr:ABC transporter ATP-binding protein [Clostridiales bacterium]
MSRDFYFHTENLTVGYQGVPLIRDIEIHVQRGEILTLIGPNGAGKTTIMKSIIRQLAPLAGVVCLDGKSLQAISPQELSEKMSVVLTERIHPERMTCEDVVATGRYPYTGRFGILGERDRQAVREAMEAVNILDLAECDFEKTSDGQKQRIMLARAFCQEPELIVLDEPTSFLDIRYKLEFLTVLQKMARERDLSVILSLHELDLAERISDRVACIRDDRIDRLGTPEEIFTDGYIESLFQVTAGSCDGRTGSLELAAPRGKPEVFVIAGCGTGMPVFRRLQREAVPFATGILWENDLDYPCARALAAEVISTAPFSDAGEETYQRARQVMRSCKRVICTLDPARIGVHGDVLRRLYQEASESRALI